LSFVEHKATFVFEVLEVVAMNSMAFWVVTPCSSEESDILEEYIASIFRSEE
jgi:hypothetical protein